MTPGQTDVRTDTILMLYRAVMYEQTAEGLVNVSSLN